MAQRSGPPQGDEEERELARQIRAAVAPFDSVGPEYRQMSRDARRPSRTKAIEELPAAVGFLVAHAGDFRGAVLGAVNYGRDADSIAVMAGALAAGLGGTQVVPREWIEEIERASRTDVTATGELMASAARDILDRDAERARARAEQIASLQAAPVAGEVGGR